MTEIAIIAAVAENDVIGRNGDIPWHLPEDMKLFKERTSGNTVMMGRKTWQSLPDEYRPLPNRYNIVLSTTLEDSEAHCISRNYEDAISKARERENDIFIIGGASLYERALEDADRMYISRVHMEPKGDTYFPDFDEKKWRLVESEDFEEFALNEYEKIENLEEEIE